MSQIPLQPQQLAMQEENRPLIRNEPNSKENMASLPGAFRNKNEAKGSDKTNPQRRPEVLQELNKNVLQENVGSQQGNQKYIEKEVQQEEEPTIYGGILINPEDALPSKRDELMSSNDGGRTEGYHYAMLHRPSEGEKTKSASVPQNDQQVFERIFNYEFPKQKEGEHVKIGGIIIDTEDMVPAMRDQYPEGTNTVQLHHNLEISRAPEEQAKKSSQPKVPQAVATRSFYYDYPVSDRTQDVIKTGGIVINPSDALPYKQNEVHVDPKTGVGYAMLKPWSQVKDEQGGIVHNFLSKDSNTVAEKQTKSCAMKNDVQMPAKIGANEVTPNQPYQAPEMMTRNFCYEFDAPKKDEEEIVKTGGIIIGVEDMLPSVAANFHPNAQVQSVMLKPWTQIRKEQSGVVHAPAELVQSKPQDTNVWREERETTAGNQERPKVYEREFSYEYTINRETEPIKHEDN